jgi:NifU-like protein involved in Fe-S cluster formation
MAGRALSNPPVYHVAMDAAPPAADVDRILSLHRVGLHRGLPPGATHHAEVRSSFCGDRLELGLVVADGRIAAAGFDGELCSVASATASLLCGDLVGRKPTDPQSWPDDHAVQLLGVPLIRARVPCGILPMTALRAALAAGGA